MSVVLRWIGIYSLITYEMACTVNALKFRWRTFLSGCTPPLERIHFCTFNTIFDFLIRMFGVGICQRNKRHGQNDLNVKWSVLLWEAVAVVTTVTEAKCSNVLIPKVLKERFHATLVRSHLLNCIPVQLSMGVNNQPQQNESTAAVIKGTSVLIVELSAPDSGLLGRKTQKRKKKVFENVASCMFDTILYYWYDSCKVFFLNNWIIYYCMLPQSVPDLDKKITPHIFCFFYVYDLGSQFHFTTEDIKEEKHIPLWLSLAKDWSCENGLPVMGQRFRFQNGQQVSLSKTPIR